MGTGFQLQAFVQQVQPVAGGNQFPVGPEAVDQRGGGPEPSAGRDQVLHAIRGTRHLAEREVVISRKHLHLAECEEGRIGVEFLPQPRGLDFDISSLRGLQRHAHRVVPRVAEFALEHHPP